MSPSPPLTQPTVTFCALQINECSYKLSFRDTRSFLVVDSDLASVGRLSPGFLVHKNRFFFFGISTTQQKCETQKQLLKPANGSMLIQNFIFLPFHFKIKYSNLLYAVVKILA